jgi:glutaconate CoA-transferase, subunit A
MAELVALNEAVAELVHDGDSVALEGFTHLIPFAAGHELLRQHPPGAGAGQDDARPAV